MSEELTGLIASRSYSNTNIATRSCQIPADLLQTGLERHVELSISTVHVQYMYLVNIYHFAFCVHLTSTVSGRITRKVSVVGW